jgi:hypothetical protein
MADLPIFIACALIQQIIRLTFEGQSQDVASFGEFPSAFESIIFCCIKTTEVSFANTRKWIVLAEFFVLFRVKSDLIIIVLKSLLELNLTNCSSFGLVETERVSVYIASSL